MDTTFYESVIDKIHYLVCAYTKSKLQNTQGELEGEK